MNNFTALGISVAAGFLVLSFNWISKVIWQWQLENVYLRLASRSVTDISGDWVSEVSDPDEGWTIRDETTLRQYGHRIEGVSKTTTTNGNDVIVKRFVIVGVLRNDLLSAYYYNSDRKQKGSGAFTYSLNGKGQLVGKGAFYDVEADEVVSVSYTLVPATR